MNRRTLIMLALGAALLAAGCATVARVGTQVAQGSGAITEDQAGSINRTTDALEKTFQDITPEQEHYIGRAVAADILASYKPADRQSFDAYLNTLGQTLALASNRPETFGGWHLLLLDSDEINAFAAPGGLILVTKGLVRCCASEDELAAVLAHEIAHVQNRDGLKAIKKSRLTAALATIGVETARQLGDQQIRDLAGQLEGSVHDITQTLVNNGYARGLEFQADRDAVVILERLGYDPSALVRMLDTMGKRVKPGGPGFAHTHPSPADRIAEVKPEAVAMSGGEPSLRAQRFAAAMAGL
ncbi:MAG TPA: M48 family metallopeptidase [Candidatus Krumholzibacteria bacterium]|nr:M48 family metallopeptidase [Candidatus Krumholzibacteria bacterium]